MSKSYKVRFIVDLPVETAMWIDQQVKTGVSKSMAEVVHKLVEQAKIIGE